MKISQSPTQNSSLKSIRSQLARFDALDWVAGLLLYRNTSIYRLPTHRHLKAAVIANSKIVLR